MWGLRIRSRSSSGGRRKERHRTPVLTMAVGTGLVSDTIPPFSPVQSSRLTQLGHRAGQTPLLSTRGDILLSLP